MSYETFKDDLFKLCSEHGLYLLGRVNFGRLPEDCQNVEYEISDPRPGVYGDVSKAGKYIGANLIYRQSEPVKTAKSFQVISDYVGEGVKGIVNPADGKRYDSKSQYYKSVKSAGCVVMGSDAPKEGKKEVSGDFDCKRELKAALEHHTQGGNLRIDSRR